MFNAERDQDGRCKKERSQESVEISGVLSLRPAVRVRCINTQAHDSSPA